METDFPNVGTAFNIGTVIDFSERQHLLFSVGRSIDGPTKFQCYIAWQFTFDNSLFKSHSHLATRQMTAGVRSCRAHVIFWVAVSGS